MTKTTPAISMQMTTTVPVYKPYLEDQNQHHSHNRMFTPLAYPQVDHLSRLFTEAEGGDVKASIHDNGLLKLQTRTSGNIRHLMKDMHYAQDVLRMVADEENYLVGSYANLPNSAPDKFKPHKCTSPLLHYMHQQGKSGHDAIDFLTMNARASFTFSTPDLAIADTLLKVATVISPVLQLMMANQSNFQRGEERRYDNSVDLSLSYNHTYDNTGSALQRAGLVTQVISSNNPFRTFLDYADDLKEYHSLHPNSKLDELAKDKKAGKSAYDAKGQRIHLFMPDVEAKYDLYNETYNVTLHVDYNAQPAPALAFMHSLLGTIHNLNGTASLLDDVEMSITGDASQETERKVASIRENAFAFDADQSNLHPLMYALFNNNNRDSCVSSAIRNNMHLNESHVISAFPHEFDSLGELYASEKAVHQAALQRLQPAMVMGG